MRRRTFLGVLTSFSWLLVSPSASAKNKKSRPPMLAHSRNDILLDQSGSSPPRVFVIGALSCSSYSRATANINGLRSATRFRCTLSHRSRNKWKVEYAKRLIDYWIDKSSIKIEVMVLKGLETKRRIEDLSRYSETVARLVEVSSRNLKGQCRLVSQRHFPKARQGQFETMLALRTKRYGSIHYIEASQSDLLQFLDLVVGAIRMGQKEAYPQLENQIKADLVHYLERKLGVTSLEKPLTHPKCSLAFA